MSRCCSGARASKTWPLAATAWVRAVRASGVAKLVDQFVGDGGGVWGWIVVISACWM